MKKTKLFAVAGVLTLSAAAFFLMGADHLDAPAVAGTDEDLGDLYAFEGENPDNTVFVATLQGALQPGVVTDNAKFNEDILVEFNIDNDGDFIEDVVIQAIKRADTMYFFGPTNVAEPGLRSEVQVDATRNQVQISTSEERFTTDNDGMKFFAGPVRDPFFFDFNRWNLVASGDAAPEGFLPEGEASDFFEELNTLAIVVEVPNSLLGSAPEHIGNSAGLEDLPNAYNVWVSTKRKQ